MIRRAFTMLELVFVIVVLGILAVAIIPQMDRDNIGEAAYQVARHVRLAQHYALVEDRFENTTPANDWRKTMWRIAFRDGECYSVYADRDGSGGIPAESERAVDPMTKEWVWSNTSCSDSVDGANEEVLLWKKYGVSGVTVCGGGLKNIAFDNMGRPGRISGGANGTMIFLNADCDIGITTNDGNSATVRVHQDTGFVEVILP